MKTYCRLEIKYLHIHILCSIYFNIIQDHDTFLWHSSNECLEIIGHGNIFGLIIVIILNSSNSSENSIWSSNSGILIALNCLDIPIIYLIFIKTKSIVALCSSLNLIYIAIYCYKC